MRVYSWSTDSDEAAALGGAVGRAQPWAANSPSTIVGAKLHIEVRSQNNSAGAAIDCRADVGGGQVDGESAEARLLACLTLQSPAARAAGTAPMLGVAAPARLPYSPRTATVAPAPFHWGDTGVGTYWDLATIQIWPGCDGCLPVYCEDTVRLHVRPRAPGASPFVWALAATLTLWVTTDG